MNILYSRFDLVTLSFMYVGIKFAHSEPIVNISIAEIVQPTQLESERIDYEMVGSLLGFYICSTLYSQFFLLRL